MKIEGNHYRTIWPSFQEDFVTIIDQTSLPHRLNFLRIDSLGKMMIAIKSMQVRGAPLIGVAAAYGMALAAYENCNHETLKKSAELLIHSRPTAVNLRWAVERMQAVLLTVEPELRVKIAWQEAAKIANEDVVQNQAIGEHGLALIRQLMINKTATDLHVLTHCNAGWLATVDYGTALAPIYAAHDSGLNVHVWVSETRPRNQGSSLTAWELSQHGVPHTVITDNAAGYLIQKKLVDMVIVGADRVTRHGDVCNKIGTYLKALAANAHGIPFYAAVPAPTIDWQIESADIDIEMRAQNEISHITGMAENGDVVQVRLMPETSSAWNPAFDVTPSRFVSGIITERGVFAPDDLKVLSHA